MITFIGNKSFPTYNRAHRFSKAHGTLATDIITQAFPGVFGTGVKYEYQNGTRYIKDKEEVVKKKTKRAIDKKEEKNTIA